MSDDASEGTEKRRGVGRERQGVRAELGKERVGTTSMTTRSAMRPFPTHALRRPHSLC